MTVIQFKTEYITDSKQYNTDNDYNNILLLYSFKKTPVRMESGQSKTNVSTLVNTVLQYGNYYSCDATPVKCLQNHKGKSKKLFE